MTRASIREYTEAVRGRYLRASKMEKRKILDEFTEVIGCHRKAAIRLFSRGNQQNAKRKRCRVSLESRLALAERDTATWNRGNR